MSENYISSDGFKPLVLPLTGEELMPGRQYALTPLVRLILLDEYGVQGVPTIVECIRCRAAATQVSTKTENLETGEVKTSSHILPAQQATFKSFLSKDRKVLFELDITRLEELAPFYDKSHKLPEMEEEWFEVTSQQSNTKFRGQPLRWWARGDSGASPMAKKMSTRSVVAKIDLSILNLA